MQKKLDRYTKVTLTMLTIGVWGLLLRPLFSLMPAEAQQPLQNPVVGILSAKQINTDQINVAQWAGGQVTTTSLIVAQGGRTAALLDSKGISAPFIQSASIDVTNEKRTGTIKVNAVNAGVLSGSDYLLTPIVNASKRVNAPVISTYSLQIKDKAGHGYAISIVNGRLVTLPLPQQKQP